MSRPLGGQKRSEGPRPAPPTRWLYLHGLGSGPESFKGRAFTAHLATRGVPVERLDLRKPSFRGLRLTAMVDTVTTAIGGPEERAVLIGSSLGGLTAARVAALDARVVGLVLLAPALGFGSWRERNPLLARVWEKKGWLGLQDHVTGDLVPVDVGFLHDLESWGLEVPPTRVPVLVLHGLRDETVPIEHSRAWVARCGDTRLVELEDGHELVASVERLLAEAEAFLDAQGWLPRPPAADR